MRRTIAVILATLMFFASCASTPPTKPEESSKTDTAPAKESEVSQVPAEQDTDKEIEEDTHTAEEKKAFELFSTLQEQALSVLYWYFSDTAEDLNIATQSEHAPYYKVGKFSTIAEMKAATNEVFTQTFSEKLFYDHAFSPLSENVYMYKEIDGQLYRNIDTGGFGWLSQSTDEYYLPYMDDEKIIITVKNVLPEKEETWVNFLLRNENGDWKFDTYYEFNPYIENERFIAPAVSSWLCVKDWNDVNELDPNSLINFYLYTYLSGVTEEYDDEIGYEVSSAKVMEGLSVYFDNLKLDTLTAINENKYASATYNQETDSFFFHITFDPANFMVISSAAANGVTTLEVAVIGKDDTLSYSSYLDLVIGENGFQYVEKEPAGIFGYWADGFKYTGNKAI